MFLCSFIEEVILNITHVLMTMLVYIYECMF